MPYICVDPKPAGSPGARDDEEHIEVLRYTRQELQEAMCSGEMLLPSLTTCVMALAWIDNHMNPEAQ